MWRNWPGLADGVADVHDANVEEREGGREREEKELPKEIDKTVVGCGVTRGH